ncbi:XdhC family protein [Candidatus Pristimantibacillus sp. PTI5]|uniref:XdhC family protein n=1 Tax=Candidatus Pristimantibacillus sp. PTI5 TaxID=3400422 RepID=UPI003B015EEF
MDMHELLDSIASGNDRSVLATILCVEGHSYRKAGAAMLFTASGKQIGSVSPGCLEQDLQEQALKVRESGQFECVTYNLNADEDVIWGEAVGCGGELRILLEPVENRLREVLLEAKRRNGTGQSVRLVRSWDEKEIGYTLHDSSDSFEDMDNREDKDDVPNQLSVVISPRPRLVLFGAGQDAEAIYSLVKQIGFHVVMADWRPSLCSEERFPGAECVIGTAEQIVERLQFRSNDYLIVCSHNLQRDKDMIRLALPVPLVYLGILGSKKRIRMLFETFLIPSNVRAPIGLSIGADGPHEIAVSVAAELIAIRAGRQAGLRKGRGRDAYFSPLFSGGTEQTHGNAKAVARAGERPAARKPGATCFINQSTYKR